MNRTEFLKQLESLLADISAEEREEAMEYYKGYFEDAGVEYEEDVIKELESPAKVAATIKAELKGADHTGEYTENGYESDIKESKEELLTKADAQKSKDQEDKDASEYGYSYNGSNGKGYSNNNSYSNNSSYSKNNSKTTNDIQKQNKTLRTILIIVIAVITCPIWGGILMGLIGVLIGIIAAIFGIGIGLICGTGGVFIAGLVVICVSIVRFATLGIASAIALMGAGLILIALAALGLVLSVLYCGRLLPWMVRGVVSICKKGFSFGKEKLA